MTISFEIMYMLKSFKIYVTSSSTTKTVNHVDLNSEEEELVSVSLCILKFQGFFRTPPLYLLLSVL